MDRGCRADFAIDSYQYRGPAPGSVGTVSCSSDDGQRHYCTVDSGGRVRLQQQRSDSPCREGYSWGSDGKVIWVDHGCRADFAVEGAGAAGTANSDGRDPQSGRNRTGAARGQNQVISCSSDDMHRHYCPADTRGGVQLLKQRSESSCRKAAAGATTAAAFGWTMAAGPISRSFGSLPNGPNSGHRWAAGGFDSR